MLIALLTMISYTTKAETIEYRTDGFVYSLNTEIQEASFDDYEGDATKIVVPEFVTYEGKAYKVTSFRPFGNSLLTAIEIPATVTNFGDFCFIDCSSLESIVVDANNPKYDSREGCNAIIETKSITMIAGYKSTKIPSSMTSLGVGCFNGCSSLVSIVVDANNPIYDSREGCNAILETESEVRLFALLS